jgi:hypothetical protein
LYPTIPLSDSTPCGRRRQGTVLNGHHRSGLDGAAVGHGIAEGHAQLDDVGAYLFFRKKKGNFYGEILCFNMFHGDFFNLMVIFLMFLI